ncbi:MAG: hypothetical protein AB7S71_11035 [Dongiaceae bacterium]
MFPPKVDEDWDDLMNRLGIDLAAEAVRRTIGRVRLMDPETEPSPHMNGRARDHEAQPIDETATDPLGGQRSASPQQPELVVDYGNLPATARELRTLLAASRYVFDRGVPVKVIRQADGSPPSAMRLTANNVVFETHKLCQPVKRSKRGDDFVPVTLPDRVARMYLDMGGEWGLPPLAGIATSPLLAPDGTVRSADGYDRATGLWCASIPQLMLPKRPSRTDADAALQLLRETFRTFLFADAARRRDHDLGAKIGQLVGTRTGGFVMTRQEAAGEWGAATYTLRQTSLDPADVNSHRDHRGHLNDGEVQPGPMPPMVPMPDADESVDLPAREEIEL